jgi:hypothetical protein
MRQANGVNQDYFEMRVDHGAGTDADVTRYVLKAERAMVIDSVDILSEAGVTANASNFVNIKLVKGASTVVANWSTETGQEGTMTAATFHDMTMTATAADARLAVGDTLKLFCDESGTYNITAGTAVIRGRYL